MPNETGPIVFYDQRFGGTDLPEVSGVVSEETRLRAAPIGAYELHFRQQPHYQLSGGFLFNEEESDTQSSGQRPRFEVLEDIAGIERTMIIRSIGDGINLESVEIIPLDWKERSLELTAIDVSESQRTIRYAKNPPPESLKLKVSGLNVFEVETIKTSLWVNDRHFSQGSLTASIVRPDEIWIDRLNSSGGRKRKIEEHLLAFFNIVLGNTPDRRFDFKCSYRYQIGGDGLYASLPVLNPQSLTLDTSGELFSALLSFLNNWYENASPPKGVFDFGVKIYGAAPQNSVPVLDFTTLLLPIESIAGWTDSKVQ